MGWSRNEILLTGPCRELHARVHRAFFAVELAGQAALLLRFVLFKTSNTLFNPSKGFNLSLNLCHPPTLVIFFLFSLFSLFLYFFLLLISQSPVRERIRKILYPDYRRFPQFRPLPARNCSHFSRKRAIMQAKPACKHFIFQTGAAFPFETPESDRSF